MQKTLYSYDCVVENFVWETQRKSLPESLFPYHLIDLPPLILGWLTSEGTGLIVCSSGDPIKFFWPNAPMLWGGPTKSSGSYSAPRPASSDKRIPFSTLLACSRLWPCGEPKGFRATLRWARSGKCPITLVAVAQ